MVFIDINQHTFWAVYRPGVRLRFSCVIVVFMSAGRMQKDHLCTREAAASRNSSRLVASTSPWADGEPADAEDGVRHQRGGGGGQHGGEFGSWLLVC